MNKKDNARLNMVEASLKVLDKYPDEWNTNAPAGRRIAAVRADYAALLQAVQSGSTVNTGITDDKETAGDAAITAAMRLVRLTQSYADEQKNGELQAQLQVSATSLDAMSDAELTLKLRDLHQRIKQVGQPLAEYGITTAKLDALAGLIDKFDNMKQAPRLATASRSASNASVPALLTKIQANLRMLDNLLKGLDDVDPHFLAEYLKARVVVNFGGGGKKDDNDDEKKPQA